MVSKEEAKKIIDILSKEYPGAKPALAYNNPYELLVAVILSAQCTDERVNKVTSELFKEYNTPEKMVTLGYDELSSIIFPCGLNNSKAKHIIDASREIIEKYDGKVPSTFEELITLPGVGRKTANVVYAVAFDGDAIAVDTHVFRVSNRIGLANSNTPEKTEMDLRSVLDKKVWSKAHHYLIWHGRKVCSSQKPKCDGCVLKSKCKYNLEKNK